MSFRNDACVVPLFALLLSPQLAAAQETATDVDNQSAGLQEIVITAQKRSESAQSAPIAVTALSGDALQGRGIASAQDLNGLAPATQFQPNQNDSVNVSIRGISNNNVQIVGDPAIAYNWNGVTILHPIGLPAGFFDMERIEVVRGPQGTLYGRNATGGAVNFITNPPSDHFEGEVQSTVGNYNLVDVAGMLNLPVSRTLSLRGDAQRTQHSGYTEDGFNDQRTTSGRLAGLWRPTDDLSLLIGTDFTKQGGRGAGFSACPPGSAAAGPALAPLIADYCTGVPWRPFAGSPVDALQRTAFIDVDNFGIYADLEAHLPFGDLTYIPAFRNVDQSALPLGITTVPLPIFGGQYGHVANDILDDQDQAQTHELRLASPAGSRAQWVLGLYYLNERTKDFRNSITNAPFLGPGGFTLHTFTENRERYTADSRAAFGQITYPIITRVRLTLGARYTCDTKDSYGDSTVLNADGSQVLVPGNGHLFFDKFNWRAGIDADVAKHSLLYASVSTGYKSGGFNPGLLSTYPAEQITAYETGLKNEFLDRRLRVNLTAFYYRYSNFQFQYFGVIPVALPGGGSTEVQQSVTAPAARTSMKGAELEARLQVTHSDEIHLSGSYLDARFDQFLLAGTDYSGNPVPFSPRFSLTGSVQHTVRFANGADIAARLETSFDTVQWTYYYPAPGSRQPAFTQTSLTLSYDPPSGNWHVSVWGRNLENNWQMTQYLAQSPFNPTVALVGPPRTFGATADVRF